MWTGCGCWERNLRCISFAFKVNSTQEGARRCKEKAYYVYREKGVSRYIMIIIQYIIYNYLIYTIRHIHTVQRQNVMYINIHRCFWCGHWMSKKHAGWTSLHCCSSERIFFLGRGLCTKRNENNTVQISTVLYSEFRWIQNVPYLYHFISIYDCSTSHDLQACSKLLPESRPSNIFKHLYTLWLACVSSRTPAW